MGAPTHCCSEGQQHLKPRPGALSSLCSQGRCFLRGEQGGSRAPPWRQLAPALPSQPHPVLLVGGAVLLPWNLESGWPPPTRRKGRMDGSWPGPLTLSATQVPMHTPHKHECTCHACKHSLPHTYKHAHRVGEKRGQKHTGGCSRCSPGPHPPGFPGCSPVLGPFPFPWGLVHPSPHARPRPPQSATSSCPCTPHRSAQPCLALGLAMTGGPPTCSYPSPRPVTPSLLPASSLRTPTPTCRLGSSFSPCPAWDPPELPWASR